MFLCLSASSSNQKETGSDSLHSALTETCETAVRESWLKPTRSGGEWVEEGGGVSVPSVPASSCRNFYLLAQSYLEYLACLALWVANFSAFHTDLSSGSPGAEGCSGNSQRSFSSETHKQRQRVKDKGARHVSGCRLLVHVVQTVGLVQSAAAAGVCTSGSKTAPLYTGLAVVRLFLSCLLL